MIQHKQKLSGVMPPIITPLNEDETIDIDAIERLVETMLARAVSGIFVLGSSGEGPWLSPQQQTTMIREVVRCVNGQVPILAGALDPGTVGTLETVQRHADAGADVIVITSPYYFPADAATQIQHIETIIQQTTLPVMLYNIPQTTHNPLVAETVRQVLHIEQIIGIKDSAGDWDNFVKLIEYRQEKPEFAIFQGSEKLATQSILAGADGIVPGLANLIPGHFVALIRALQANHSDQAEAIQAKINQLSALHSYDFWLTGLKFAASHLGFGSSTAIGRKIQLDQDARQAIINLVEMINDNALTHG